MGKKKLEVVLPPINATPEEIARALFGEREIEDLGPTTNPKRKSNHFDDEDT